MTKTERLKGVGSQAGALVVGVAAADAFNEFVPEGRRPEDILPGAQSVIVAGSKGLTAGAWRCPDHPLEKDVCPAPPCVQMYRKLGATPCLASCPASEGGCLDGVIGEDGRIAYSSYDRERCTARAMNFGVSGLQKSLVQIVVEDDAVKRRSMIYSDFSTQSLSSLSFVKESVAQCFECMRVCPVGRVHRRLK